MIEGLGTEAYKTGLYFHRKELLNVLRLFAKVQYVFDDFFGVFFKTPDFGEGTGILGYFPYIFMGYVRFSE